MMNVISFVPDSLLQFETLTIPPDCFRTRTTFFEEPSGTGEDGAPIFTLRLLEEDPDTGNMMIRDRAGLRQASLDGHYSVQRKAVFETLEGQWVPLPFFAIEGDDRDRPLLGPTNWVRGRLRSVADGDRSEILKLDLVIDTRIPTKDESARNDEMRFAPSALDASRNQRFVFTTASDVLSAWLSGEWLNDWLAELLEERRKARTGRRPIYDGESAPVLEHLAIFISFLKMIEASEALPDLKLLNVAGGSPVEVDLVLDLGNFRSCGILIEEHPGEIQREADSYALVLRDMAEPEKTYNEPFSSRVEFAKPSYGNDFYSRRSGAPRAFSWPSPVRTGPEAERLMSARIGTEGLSGLSTPKRYLWDTRPSDQGWRYNLGPSQQPGFVDPDVKAPFRRDLHKLMLQTSLRAAREDIDAANPVAPCCLSRSQVFILMLSELVLQAVMLMNAPQYRARRRDTARWRRLRSLILTMPPGMPVAEQRIFRLRAQAAVNLAWEQSGQPGTAPRLRAELDEATATQIVWLHNEVTQRLDGQVDTLFELYGHKEQSGQPALRVASLDIGGGTTDLMITRYAYAGGDTIEPTQEFRESVGVAGDDLLESVIATIIVPAIAKALDAQGVDAPMRLLGRILTRDHGNQDERERHLRRLFVSTVLEPAALRVLSLYEEIDSLGDGSLKPFTLGDAVRPELNDTAQRARCVAFLLGQLGRPCASDAGFDPYDIEVSADVASVERAIRETLERVVDGLCEVVALYRCDVLLLSGRPSKLRRLRETITSALPVPPHRLVAMHDYRVGPHYPFADAAHKIADPKTTVVVGAALCTQAEGKLTNFVLRTGSLHMKSTARFIGKMDRAGQIREQDELVRNIDLDAPASNEELVLNIDNFEGRTVIGYRQLPLERWWAGALYSLTITPGRERQFAAVPRPIRVSFMRKEEIDSELEEAGDFTRREMFVVSDVTGFPDTQENPNLVTLRLQTTLSPEGYWRDTGCLTLDKTAP